MSSVKRKHHHIVEIGLSLLATANVPLTLWDLAFEPTTYLINRLPSKVTQKKSPYECLFNISHDYKFLKTFGCECWPFLRPYNSIKLSFRSTSCVFIGYNKNHLGYKCLHISSDRVYIARHVVFNENNFPFLNSNPTRSSSPSTITTSVSVPLVAPSNHIHSRHHDDANSTPFLEPSPTASHTTEIDTESPYIDALIPLASPSNHIHSKHRDDASSTPFLEPSPTALHTTETNTESPYIDALIPLAPPTESEPAPSP
jgi:hypothetical protein